MNDAKPLFTTRGFIESAVPTIAFVITYTASGSRTELSAIVAVSVALVLAAARLARRESPRDALSGLAGVGISAFIAARSGRAENFYLPGLILNAVYATAFIVSNVVRWPLVGVVVSMIDGEGMAWREDPERMRIFRLATWMWAGMFLLRLVVKLPLYLAHSVVVLGVVNTAMGLPLFAITVWLTFRLVRRAPPPAPTSG